MKPNTKFELNVRDVELIEDALRSRMGRLFWNPSSTAKEEVKEIQDLLGRIHNKKVWYTPKGKFIGGG
jgi:hypothetical protein